MIFYHDVQKSSRKNIQQACAEKQCIREFFRTGTMNCYESEILDQDKTSVVLFWERTSLMYLANELCVIGGENLDMDNFDLKSIM